MLGYRKQIRVVAFLGVAILTSGSASAGERPEFAPGRPGQTEPSTVVPVRFFQIELGWAVSQGGDFAEKTRSHEFPSTVLRMGVLPGTELRFGLSGWDWEDEPGGGNNGFQGGAIGTLVQLWNEEGRLPETAFLFTLSDSQGESGISWKGLDPAFLVAFSNTLSDRVSLGYHVGMSWSTEEGENGGSKRLSSLNYSSTLGLDLTPKLGTFLELYGDVPMNHSSGPAHSWDGGFAFLVSENIQLDLSGGFGLTDSADDWFLGLGVSLRLPR